MIAHYEPARPACATALRDRALGEWSRVMPMPRRTDGLSTYAGAIKVPTKQFGQRLLPAIDAEPSNADHPTKLIAPQGPNGGRPLDSPPRKSQAIGLSAETSGACDPAGEITPRDPPATCHRGHATRPRRPARRSRSSRRRKSDHGYRRKPPALRPTLCCSRQVPPTLDEVIPIEVMSDGVRTEPH
jgi:hypothetical protein